MSENQDKHPTDKRECPECHVDLSRHVHRMDCNYEWRKKRQLRAEYGLDDSQVFFILSVANRGELK